MDTEKTSPLKMADYSNPAVKASLCIKQAEKQLNLFSASPIFLGAAVLVGFSFYQPQWWKDPFLLLIFAIFIAGQIMILRHFKKLKTEISSAAATVNILIDAGDNPDLNSLSNKLKTGVRPCAERDLILYWLDIGQKGEYQSGMNLSQNALDRFRIESGASLDTHTILNRTTLKMGFLGTLIGLVQTFPPMKRAILGLADKNGESRFIRDIASAIDGDEYAILTTLVATGLSVIIETLSIHILQLICGRFEELFGHLNDWYLCVILPVVQKEYSMNGKQLKLMESQNETSIKRTELQTMVQQHVREISELMKLSFAQVRELGRMQNNVRQRMSELIDFEREYVNYVLAEKDVSVFKTGPKGTLYENS
jgi:hypothetical protein